MGVSHLERYKIDIEKLSTKGSQLLSILKEDDKNLIKFRSEYESWYSEALNVVKVILPDRLGDFRNYYDSYDNKKGDSLKKAINYVPPQYEDIAIGYQPPKIIEIARALFTNQLNILRTARNTFQSSLFSIKEILQADLFDSELDAATELNGKGFSRGAGALAGVVLERHLAHVSQKHNIKIAKKNPCLSDYYEVLKNGQVIDIPVWRFIQHLGDIRNLCDHDKKINPTKEQVTELIDGVKKVSKTVY